jgi:DNA-binding PadR family transcriptional regulator
MSDCDPGGDLKRLVLHYIKDQGGFIRYEDWHRFDQETWGELDPVLQNQWIPGGYIRNNPEKGGYELTASGRQELKRLTVVKFRDTQAQSE